MTHLRSVAQTLSLRKALTRIPEREPCFISALGLIDLQQRFRDFFFQNILCCGVSSDRTAAVDEPRRDKKKKINTAPGLVPGPRDSTRTCVQVQPSTTGTETTEQEQ